MVKREIYQKHKSDNQIYCSVFGTTKSIKIKQTNNRDLTLFIYFYCYAILYSLLLYFMEHVFSIPKALKTILLLQMLLFEVQETENSRTFLLSFHGDCYVKKLNLDTITLLDVLFCISFKTMFLKMFIKIIDNLYRCVLVHRHHGFT